VLEPGLKEQFGKLSCRKVPWGWIPPLTPFFGICQGWLPKLARNEW